MSIPMKSTASAARPKLLIFAAVFLAIVAVWVHRAKLRAAAKSGPGSSKVLVSNSDLKRFRFSTPWQEESQFIVESIVTDLAEMATYAKTKQ